MIISQTIMVTPFTTAHNCIFAGRDMAQYMATNTIILFTSLPVLDAI